MSELSWGDGRHLTAREDRILAALAAGEQPTLRERDRAAVAHLHALRVIANGPEGELQLTGLGKYSASLLGHEIKHPSFSQRDDRKEIG